MAIDSAGYTRLKVILEGMTSKLSGFDGRIYLLWHVRRFKIIEAQLEAACKCERVRVFMDEYADGLVDELQAALSQGAPIEPGQIAIGYIEALATQTRRFAEHIESESESVTDNPNEIGD